MDISTALHDSNPSKHRDKPWVGIWEPYLFKFFMNDIHNASANFRAILFADDANFTSTLCSFDVNIDNNYTWMQLSAHIIKQLDINVVRNKQTITWC